MEKASQPAAQETQQSPGFHPWVGKISPEKEMAMHSRTCAWKLSWTEGLVGTVLGDAESDRLSDFTSSLVRQAWD